MERFLPWLQSCPAPDVCTTAAVAMGLAIMGGVCNNLSIEVFVHKDVGVRLPGVPLPFLLFKLFSELVTVKLIFLLISVESDVLGAP